MATTEGQSLLASRGDKLAMAIRFVKGARTGLATRPRPSTLRTDRPMHIPDLTTKPLLFPGAAPVPVRHVGWLSDKHPFGTGKVDRSVLRRLKEFQAASRSGWQPYLSLGRHTCEMCEDATSWTHLFIPADGFMYCAPEGIVHYIVDHRYAPPLEFWVVGQFENR